VVNSWGKSEAMIEGYSQAENRDIKDSMDRVRSASEKISQENNVTSLKSADMSASMGGNLSAIGLSVGANASYSSREANQTTLAKAKDFGVSETDLHNVSKGLNAARDNRVTFGSDTAQKASDSMRSSMDTSHSLQDQLSVHQSRAQKYSEVAAATQNMGAGFNANINDDILQYVSVSRFNNNTNDAMQWASKNREAFQEEGRRYMNGYLEHTQSWLKDSGRTHIDPEMIGITYGQFKEQTLMRGKSLMESGPGNNNMQGSPSIQQQDSRNAPHERPQTGRSMEASALQAQRSKFGLGDNFGEEFKESAALAKQKSETARTVDIQKPDTASESQVLEEKFTNRREGNKLMRTFSDE